MAFVRTSAPSVIVVLALTLAVPCSADERNPRFGHLRLEDGLSGSWVQSIAKDSRGFLWFGTEDGLNRNAGGVLKAYRHDPADPKSLPIKAVTAILEDSRGRLWLGGGMGTGRGGLARYDFEQDRFVSFRADGGGQRPTQVHAVVEDRRHLIWIADQRGLYCYDESKDSFTLYQHQAGVEASLSGGGVLSLLLDRQDRLWVGTRSGLDSIDTRTGRIDHWPIRPRGPGASGRLSVWALLEGEGGTLWVGTQGDGLHHFDPATGRDRRHFRAGDSSANSIGGDDVFSLADDGQGRLFVGLDNAGLDILDIRSGRFTHYTPRPEDPSSLSAKSIHSLLFDDRGILWIGTFHRGVDVLSPLAQRFDLVRPGRGGLSGAQVRAIVEDRRGDLWIGTDGDGLNRLDRRTGRITVYRHDPSDPTSIGSDVTMALCEDRQGRLWVGGWYSGLSSFDRANGRFVTYRHPREAGLPAEVDVVSDIREMSDGKLALATWGGVRLFDPRTKTFRPLSDVYPGAGLNAYPGAELSAGLGRFDRILDDGRGGLWLGSMSRLEVVDQRSGRMTAYQHDPLDPQTLASGAVSAFHLDSHGNVWVGSEGGLTVFEAGPVPGAGSSRDQESTRLHRVRLHDDVPQDSIASILEDDEGNLWISTTRGLVEMIEGVRLPAQPKMLFFDVRDGLQGTEFSHGSGYRSRSGELFFGGMNGLSHFFPGRIRTNTVPPPVVITEMRILNRPVEVGAPASPLFRHVALTEEVTLSHDQNVIRLEFAALDFAVSRKNRYAYRLEGLEQDWNRVGMQHSATYAGLQPGDYVFRVRAANGDGVWNTTGASLRIRVRPPFWGEPWFRLLSAAILVVAVIVAARQYARSVTRRRSEEQMRRLNVELEERVKQRTEQLQAETERLAVTLRSIGDGVIATDVEANIVILNRAAEQMTGWSASDALGTHLSKVLPLVDPATRAPVPNWAGAALSGQTGVQPLPTALLLARDGRELLISNSASVIRDPESRPIGVVVVFRDISDEERIEGELQKAAKLESLGLLAGGIAHDFNNLLAGIFGQIELAQRAVAGNIRGAHHLQQALAVMARARGLTQQLLTFTTAGQPVTAPVALDELLRDTTRFALAGSNLDFKLDLTPDLWVCQADSRQIGQVVENLLINARQAMPDGGTVQIAAGNVTIATGNPLGLAAGRYVKVSITDRGRGIAREIQDKVFDPFFTTKPNGTGLGLAVSYSIIKRHAGHISLVSTPGVGTTVTFHLPAAAEGAMAESSTPPEPPRGRGRILVMDDEEPLREIARTALQDLGYEVVVARNGSEARALVEKAVAEGKPFDVAILDLTIPGQRGGREVLAELRTLAPNLRAIAASGYSSDPLMGRPEDYGFAAALAKPFRIGELADVVRLALTST